MPERTACAWLCLQQVPALGPVSLRQLFDAYTTPDRALAATASDWRERRVHVSVLEARRLALAARPQVETWLARIAAIGGWVMTINDDDYPPRLLELDSAPTVLFGFGERSALSPDEAVAIIGTRRPTRAGLLQAEQMSREIAAAGVTVVSGLARGIDGAAHRGALQTGLTVAVLGSGLDVMYPPEHRRLARDIAASGAVITEFPPGTQPDPFRFPQRNRLITGLSKLVYVVEAGPRSGTVKTVDSAIKTKTVLVWAGHPASPQSAVTRKFMNEGAQPCKTSGQLLAILRNESEAAANGDRAVAPTPDMPAGPAGTVLAALADAGEASPPQLAAACGLPLPAVLSVLMLLELQGHVMQLPGSRYAALVLPDRNLAGSASL